jgi:hypothetical protein
VFDKRAAEAHKGGALVRCLFKSGESSRGLRAPRRALRRKDHDLVASSSALNIASGGQAFSPLAAA